MKRFVKVLGFVGLALAVLVAVGLTATVGWRPVLGPRARSLTDRRFEPSPGRLARGEYLLTSGQTPCVMCHSELKANADQRLEVVPGMRLAGRKWDVDGLPFLVAPNLTPDPETGIGTWTDDQLARAVREGISHDGRTLFPVMPYQRLREMADEDLASVIVYLRAQPPVKHALPRSDVPFPLSRLINSAPHPVQEPVSADTSTLVSRGKYIVGIAVCQDCHTPSDDRGAKIAGLEFGGGFPLTFTGIPDVAGANISPGVNGIPYYDEALFIETMRTGRVRERQLSSIMPTMFFRNMTDEDLKAIFAYLRTVAPVDHYVDNALRPTDCPKCGGRHGGGDRNGKRAG